MIKFLPFESRLVPMPVDNIDTDQIIPARFLKTISKEGLGDQLFNDWRYDAEGKPKPDFSNAAAIVEFRQECRAFAQRWTDVQRTALKRLGVEGDWDHPPTTMAFLPEAQGARRPAEFSPTGSRGRRHQPARCRRHPDDHHRQRLDDDPRR